MESISQFSLCFKEAKSPDVGRNDAVEAEIDEDDGDLMMMQRPAPMATPGSTTTTATSLVGDGLDN